MSLSNLLSVALIAILTLVSIADVDAQDNRQEYVRSSSPTKSGGRVYNEAAAGQRMVRIARGPNSPTAASSTANKVSSDGDFADSNRTANGGAKYDYPDLDDTSQVTAFRQAANLPPQLSFPPNNRLAQCNACGVPPQQLQFQQFQQPTIGSGFAGFQAPAGFQQQNFAAGFQQQPSFGGLAPLQAGIGVPQFNQTGGSWWTPFLTGSGYYTPLLNFRNMPAGSYLGQGLIGQPTAYVDRQPFRNLLRYISP